PLPDTATTDISPLSLHDALPIYALSAERERGDEAAAVDDRAGGEDRDAHRVDRLRDQRHRRHPTGVAAGFGALRDDGVAARLLRDRKSTRLNSSHSQISYAVFCL